MRRISIILALAILALALFVALNWSVFVAPTTLSLGFTVVQAPLGLIMLAVTAGVGALLLAHILFQQASVVLELRRAAKDLHVQRELADRAEASRFTELRGALNDEVQGLERKLIARMDETMLSLTAHLGEVEDKLDRALQVASPGPAEGGGGSS